MPKILVVDDNPQNLYMLEILLKTNKYEVMLAANGAEALELALSFPPDVVITDILMPTMDGFRLCRIWKSDEKLKEIPLIFYTATYTEKKDEEFALSLGAERYIIKPKDPDELLVIISDVLQEKNMKPEDKGNKKQPEEKDFYKEYNEALIRKLEEKMLQLEKSHNELIKSYDSTIEGWSKALDLRDEDTEGHTLRVTEMTMKLASLFDFGQEELRHIRRGAMMHDIGKVGVPDRILLKPGPLTEEEWVIMKKHPTYANDFLSPINHLRLAADIPYCHHEKWDGSGYPQGLVGEQIPLAARIFAIVDVWDALLSDRPYRKAWTREETLKYIKSQSGIQFDPQVLKVCLESGIFETEME